MKAQVKFSRTVSITMPDGRVVDLHIHVGDRVSKYTEAALTQANADAAAIVAQINGEAK